MIRRYVLFTCLFVIFGCVKERYKRVIVIGIDGMDYSLTKQLMETGELPNFARLAKEGSFSSLATSIPPQSPVAWSSVITGLDPGGHGIFDFIHRNPDTMTPYLSTSRSVEGKYFSIGKYRLPISSGKVELLRYGVPFWEKLENSGIKTFILRMPANFPPSSTASFELSGMGTPDVIGTYGTFSFYTTRLFAFAGKEISGGEVYEVYEEDGKIEAYLYGPPNPFLDPELTDDPTVKKKFVIYPDPIDDVVTVVIDNVAVVLKPGEFSEWIPFSFDLLPLQKLPAMVRFYLRSVRPELELYASPVNIDPYNPILPISTPEKFSVNLARVTGRFYTQGMPEDTKAITEGVFTRDEFLKQAKVAGDELIEQFKIILPQVKGGFFFYYFGNLDQVSHIMWRAIDTEHPAYNEKIDSKYAHVIPDLYRKFDELIGFVLENLKENDTLIVLSDHGFTSWRYAVNLNNWLLEEGYLKVKNKSVLARDPGYFVNVDWNGTKAYSLGLNGLYINVKGREKHGIVPPEEKMKILEEIKQKLLAFENPLNGERVVTRVDITERTFNREYLAKGPDMIVGYAKTYRSSDKTAIGGFGKEVVEINRDEWSGDHCMDPGSVPGVFFSNKKMKEYPKSLEEVSSFIISLYKRRGGE